jgi:hypothetical protein
VSWCGRPLDMATESPWLRWLGAWTSILIGVGTDCIDGRRLAPSIPPCCSLGQACSMLPRSFLGSNGLRPALGPLQT